MGWKRRMNTEPVFNEGGITEVLQLKPSRNGRKSSTQPGHNIAQGQGDKDEERNKEKTHGIKHWGRVRTIPRIHKQVEKFQQRGIG
eukprot:2584455-Pleurochrysis_carterae.AAC.1